MGAEHEKAAFSSSSTYLVDEHQAYEGCVPIELGTPAGTRIPLYAPPWESAQYFVDDLIDDVVRTQISAFPGSRIDKEGRLFTSGRTAVRRLVSQKYIFGESTTVLDILAQLRAHGYDIPEDYWMRPENHERIRHLHQIIQE